jgi:hypothetical protein
MQTPVRFYITQNEDQPVVRTIPVTKHPIPRLKAASEQLPSKPKGSDEPRKVVKLVRRAAGRTGLAK